MRDISRIWSNLCRQQSGLAYLEFALMLPILMTLFLGGTELSRFILVNQKVDKTATTMSDLVAQSTELSTGDLDTLFEAVEHLMNPYDFATNGRVIISSVSRPGSGTPEVQWQYSNSGSLSVSSQVGTPGTAATLPNDFSMSNNEDVIIAEVFFDYEPVYNNGLVNEGRVYKVAISKPRLGALDELN